MERCNPINVFLWQLRTAGRAGLVEHACQKQWARQAPPHPCRGSRWPGLQGGGRETPRGRGLGEEIEKAKCVWGGSLECVAGQAVV